MSDCYASNDENGLAVCAAHRWSMAGVAPGGLCIEGRLIKAEADALVLIANNETLQREAKDAWRRVDEYARIVQRVVGVCEDKYVGPPTEYGQGFQEGYNDAMGVVQAALRSPRPGRRQR